ncbi:MAG: hypothetical protein IKU10_06885 [Clostridia bacterium]|nr:hypothetical protein [Clostridia bacterium]
MPYSQKKVYAYAPLIFAVFSLGFYIPYKTQYMVVRNMGVNNLPPGTRIDPAALYWGLLNVKTMTKSEYWALTTNPQIVAKELFEQCPLRREAFLREVKPFFETKLMEEYYTTEHYSICKLYDEATYIIFHYQSNSGVQSGYLIGKTAIEKVKEDQGFLLGAYTQAESPSVILFTNELLERLLRSREKENEEAVSITQSEGENTPPQMSQSENANRSQVEATYLERLEKNKSVFTHDMIVAHLSKGKSVGRTIWGSVLLFLSFYALIFSIMGITTGLFPVLLITLPLFGVCLYFGVKNIKMAKKNRHLLKNGQYKIVKVVCTRQVEQAVYDSDGHFCGYDYVHHFSNGDQLELHYPFAVRDDPVYLVYFSDYKKICGFYNGIEYVPANDLVIEQP